MSSKLFEVLGLECPTDKISHHGYHRFYPAVLAHLEDKSFSMVEFGSPTATSRLWTEYFTMASIYYLNDVDSAEMKTDRIQTFKVKQDDKDAVGDALSRISNIQFVIDDGHHIPVNQVLTFNHVFLNNLAKGGIYIIEDIEISYWNTGFIYGYKHKDSCVEIFKGIVDSINEEFLNTADKQAVTRSTSRISPETKKWISSVQFAQNCIIIRKKTDDEMAYWGRKYRFHFQVAETKTLYITVPKKGVEYSFVRTGVEVTDNFTEKIFATWEPETFDVFAKVANPNGIAIDLGAWIGTTAIWLCKNFKHVVTVEADRVSVLNLKDNLHASDCTNTSVCTRPVASKRSQVIFGPRSQHATELNESVSTIKAVSDHRLDYTVDSITFKQIVHDCVLRDNTLCNIPVTFVKCDIEGGEEGVIEDILYYVYHNNCQAYISFHIDWWANKKIGDYAYLFDFFTTGVADPLAYLSSNPFGSLLFTPIQGKLFVKPTIPAFIIAYNQVTYVKQMVKQLEKMTTDISIIDNMSSFGPLLDYYDDEFEYTLLRQKINYGHKVYLKPHIQSLMGNVFVLTDPDLAFNDKLPADAIAQMLKTMLAMNLSIIGFALEIDHPDIRTDLRYYKMTIQEWEQQFWKKHIPHPHLELYDAEIETTFCIVNRTSTSKLKVRVAGDFTCKHLPWYKGFRSVLMNGEYESCQSNNISTNYFIGGDVQITPEKALDFVLSAASKMMTERSYVNEDIFEHLPTLYEYACKCNSIIELGVRGCVSSYPLIKGLIEGSLDISEKCSSVKRMVSVDIKKSDKVTLFEPYAKQLVKYEFYEGSDLDYKTDEMFDLVFIDTWHVKGQLRRELAKYAPLCTKYIIMHDTTVDEFVGESIRIGSNIEEQVKSSGFTLDEVKDGLWPAVEEFMNGNKEWVIEKRFVNNNGLTILRRI